MKNSNQSEHFTLHQLADGVYAAIATWQAFGHHFEANVRAAFKRQPGN